VSTGATQALVHASQGAIASGAQVHGKRIQHAEPGKIASAGFAQILGVQVAKSMPQAEALAKAVQGPVRPHDVPTSPPQISPTQQALPRSTPLPAAGTGEKPVAQVRAQLRLERSGYTPPTTTPARQVRSDTSAPQTEAGTLRTSTNITTLSPQRPDKFPTVAQQSKEEPTGIPAAPIGQAVYKFTGRSDTPATLAIAPKSESRFTMAAHAQIVPDHAQPAHAQDTVRTPVSTPKSPALPSPICADGRQMATGTATPAKPTGTQSAAQIPAGHIEPPLPQPVTAPEVSRSRQVVTPEGQTAPTNTGVAQVAVRLAHAPSPVLMSEPVREQIPTPSPAENRVPTTASHTVAPAPAKTGPASENATPSPSPSLPKVVPTSAPTLSAAPAAAGRNTKSGESFTRTEHPTHRPGFESMANPSQQHTVERTFGATPAPHQAPTIAQTPAAKPTAQPLTAKASDLSKDTAQVALSHQTQEPPRPVPATAPRTSTPARPPKAPANLAPIAPPAGAQKETTPVEDRAGASHTSVVNTVPVQEQKPQRRPASSQAPVVEQVPSPSIPQPTPVPVAHESLGPQLAPNPQPVRPSETAHPIVAAKAVPGATTVRPALGHPGTVDETKPSAGTSDVVKPESNADHVLTPSERTAPAAAGKPANASPEPVAPLPSPPSAHTGSKSAIHAQPLASKQRTQDEDEKKQDEAPSAPTNVPKPNLQTTQASTASTLEINTPKPEASQPAEHRNTAPSSQTSSTQSTASPPLLAREDLHGSVLPTGDRPPVVVPPATLPSSTGEAGLREAPAPSPTAVETAGLIDRAIQDPGLSMNVMPHSAHLSITGDAGDLSLHVRVRDGSADVNVSGTMAPLFDSKAPEVRTVLAGEGLQLGNFATDQRGGSQGHPGQPENATRHTDPHPLPAPRRTNTTTPEVQVAADRRIHVTA